MVRAAATRFKIVVVGGDVCEKGDSKSRLQQGRRVCRAGRSKLARACVPLVTVIQQLRHVSGMREGAIKKGKTLLSLRLSTVISVPLLPDRCCFSCLLRMTANGVSNATNGVATQKKVFFFDIDNCLYPKSYKIHEIMSELIDVYFQNHLSLSKEDATMLHQRYYKDYGLAIEGLVRHHKVDPLEYNAKVDDALPLEDIIKPNPQLRKLLEDLDRTKVKPWLFTNAYINHGRRVVKLLGIEDLFEGITYCDYGAEKLLCKPEKAMFAKAMEQAGVQDVSQCYFVGECLPQRLMEVL